MPIKLVGDFYSFGEGRAVRVNIGDLMTVGGDMAHVVKIGRKYVEVLFYAGQPTKGRMKVDPLSDLVTWTGSVHQ